MFDGGRCIDACSNVYAKALQINRSYINNVIPRYSFTTFAAFARLTDDGSWAFVSSPTVANMIMTYHGNESRLNTRARSTANENNIVDFMRFDCFAFGCAVRITVTLVLGAVLGQGRCGNSLGRLSKVRTTPPCYPWWMNRAAKACDAILK